MNAHQSCIAEILRLFPRAKTRGFRKALDAALAGDEYMEFEPDVIKRRVGIIPDAYVILPDVRTVICWEVSDRHRYEPGRYGPTFWILDYSCWNLVVIDVEARTKSWRKINMMADGIESCQIAKRMRERLGELDDE